MRLAFIVENPKWEQFDKVSEKFKTLGGDVVLVVRGNNKEKQKSKPVKPLLKKEADSPEALAADLRKLGKSAEEITKAVASFKASKK